MFIHQSLIRKNTPELRKKLRTIGYGTSNNEEIDSQSPNLFACKQGEKFIDTWPHYIGLKNNILKYLDYNHVVNCNDNEQLFLAVAAVRDDTDKYQWFVQGEDFYLCRLPNFTEYIHSLFITDKRLDARNDINKFINSYHKATINELFKHFNEKRILKYDS